MSVLAVGDVALPDEGRAALVLGERVMTFGDLAADLPAWASRVDGSRIAAFTARPTEAALGFALRMMSLGVTILPIHPRCRDGELRATLARYPDARYFSDDELSLRHEPLRPPAHAALGTVADDERILAILETSGTSGQPKGAKLSRRAFTASARASAENLGWTERDRWLLAMPFSHAGGLSTLTRCLAARRPVVVHEAFDPERVIRSVRGEGVTLLSVVPTMLASLLEHDDGSLSELRAMLVGGAACPPELLDACRDRKIPALATYGLTETCSQAATQPLRDRELRTSTDSGVALRGVDLRVIDATGRTLIGSEGAIRVGGPTLMSGYVGGPALAPDSFIDTGDRGLIDDRGRLHVLGRTDDLIITGGENVSPVDVENALRSILGVRDALVVGVPDSRWGQAVAALLVLAPGLDVESVLASLRGAISSFKVPRRVHVVTSIPVGKTGKPDRRSARRFFA